MRGRNQSCDHLQDSPLNVVGNASDTLSGIATVTCNGNAVSLADSTFSSDVPLDEGENLIVVEATDVAGNTGLASITVIYDPPELELKYIDEFELVWSNGRSVPMWMAAYGPMSLAAAGRVADGLVLQIADPFLVNWFVTQMRKRAVDSGRNPSEIKVMSCAPTWIGDMGKAREQTRWFPAMVGNHVADLVERYHGGELPRAFTDYIEGRKGYDYKEHADKDAEHLDFISDEIAVAI